MMTACAYYAGGFIWGSKENEDYTPELIQLKEMILAYVKAWIIKSIYLISVYIFKKIFIKKGKVLKCKRIWLFTINVLRVIKTMDNACRGYRKDTLL